MTDPRTGNELTPRPDDGLSAQDSTQQVTPLPSGEQLGVERFSAGPRAHSVALTEERAAQVVRQSGNARNVAFLAVLLIAIFIPVYWFYDLGIPALGYQGRQAQNVQVETVTDVARGYALFIANCAKCHGPQGQGGIGPPLNDQDKLFNAVQANGQPGTGHLNATYIQHVLEVGGRYVCGDANSVMPVWAQPGGPLNYRQIEELVAWLTASNGVSFQYTPATSETSAGPKPTPVTVQGWRDPNYKPPAGQPSPPACWRNPSGQIGGSGGGTASAAPIDKAGTPDNPRVIKLVETSSLQITDESGTQVTAIAVKAGETVQFQVTNKAGFDHNFYIGQAPDLQNNNTANLVGIPPFSSGTQNFTWTVPAKAGTADLQFGCSLPGHYQTMHGQFDIQ